MNLAEQQATEESEIVRLRMDFVEVISVCDWAIKDPDKMTEAINYIKSIGEDALKRARQDNHDTI